jgi:hypothetical protein
MRSDQPFPWTSRFGLEEIRRQRRKAIGVGRWFDNDLGTLVFDTDQYRPGLMASSRPWNRYV